jgi:putative PIN family toxin of toxin-antitoxin system
MQKIVIDTNVIVSSLIQRSYPFKIVYELLLDNKFDICVSEELMSEYYEVLNRPKFSRFPDFLSKAKILLAEIESKSLKFEPKLKLNLISDIDDNMILELAVECSANFIITGNSNDFTFSEYKQTKILSPKEYWENYASI